jgi:two-component system, sporulation sensor kinase E
VSFSSDDTRGEELFDINETIQNLLHLMQPHSKQKHYHVIFKSDEPEIEIFANKTEIKQVLLNLIKNAFESMSSGGTLTIVIGYRIDEHGQHVEIQVEDDGKGIKTDNLRDIFLPFYSTKKGTGENLGLGLFMCYSLIEKHHGTIKAENVSPHGTRFIVTLPCP